MVCICSVGLLALVAYGIVTLDLNALVADSCELGNRPETTRLAVMLAAGGVLLTSAFITIGGTLRHRSAPSAARSACRQLGRNRRLRVLAAVVGATLPASKLIQVFDPLWHFTGSAHARHYR